MKPLPVWAASHGSWQAVKEILKQPATWLTRRFERTSPFKTVTLCLEHRRQTELHRAAFSSGKDVLFVSIMSQGTLKEVGAFLKEHPHVQTKFRILTWHPDVEGPTIEAFRKHLTEHSDEPVRTVDQVRRAAEGWTQIAANYPNVSVRGYRSSPTMQAILVADEWCAVELLPFGAHPQLRPALLLRRGQDSDAFALFKTAFEALWLTGEALQPLEKRLPGPPRRLRD